MIISSIPQGATVSVEGMDRSMPETTAKVKASLSKGGEQEYTVKFVRSDNHIGWGGSSLLTTSSDLMGFSFARRFTASEVPGLR